MHVVSFSSTTSGFQSSSCSKNIFFPSSIIAVCSVLLCLMTFHPRSVHVKPPCSFVTAWVHLLTFQKRKKNRRGSFLFVYCAVYWILSSLNQMKLCVYVRGRGQVTSGQLGESRRRPGVVTRKGVSLSAGLRHSVAKGDHQEREREREKHEGWMGLPLASTHAVELLRPSNSLVCIPPADTSVIHLPR